MLAVLLNHLQVISFLVTTSAAKCKASEIDLWTDLAAKTVVAQVLTGYDIRLLPHWEIHAVQEQSKFSILNEPFRGTQNVFIYRVQAPIDVIMDWLLVHQPH